MWPLVTYNRLGATSRPLGRDICAGSRHVFDDELLSKTSREPFCQNPRENVSEAAGEESNDQMHRSSRIILGPNKARCHRKYGGGRREMQNLSAAKLHHDLLLSKCRSRLSTRTYLKIVGWLRSAINVE